MDYEKILKTALQSKETPFEVASWIEERFPELAESEDERIRNAIYNCVKWFGFDSCYFKDVSQEECLAWIGKQKSAEHFGLKVGHSYIGSDDAKRQSIIQVLEYAKSIPNYNQYGKDDIDKNIVWLKSLRLQNRWKPSDEQMKALSDINVTGRISFAGQGQELINLYNDLKKLK